MYNKRLDQLCHYAGVYPKTRATFDFFCEEQLNSLNSLDIFSVWEKPNAWVESNYAHNKKIIFVSGDASFPWLEARDGVSEVGWGMGFAGKRVLVVSQFIDSIEIQVPKLNQIFKRLLIPEILFNISLLLCLKEE
jgi:hypothetical protein